MIAMRRVVEILIGAPFGPVLLPLDQVLITALVCYAGAAIEVRDPK